MALVKEIKYKKNSEYSFIQDSKNGDRSKIKTQFVNNIFFFYNCQKKLSNL
jgi:hypothetical protein